MNVHHLDYMYVHVPHIAKMRKSNVGTHVHVGHHIELISLYGIVITDTLERSDAMVMNTTTIRALKHCDGSLWCHISSGVQHGVASVQHGVASVQHGVVYSMEWCTAWRNGVKLEHMCVRWEHSVTSTVRTKLGPGKNVRIIEISDNQGCLYSNVCIYTRKCIHVHVCIRVRIIECSDNRVLDNRSSDNQGFTVLAK